MKKKIINGIMMVALVAATSTSFVSCKDTNEDVRIEQDSKIADLQRRLQAVEDDYAKIGYVDEQVTQAKNELRTLINGKADKTAFDNLDKEVTQIELWVAETFSKLITNVEISGTYNNMLGSVNIPGFEPKMLINNYGIAAADGSFPKSDLYKGEKIEWVQNDVLGAGSGKYATPGFAGYIYANVNRYIDIPLFTKDQDSLSIFKVTLANTAGEDVKDLKIVNMDEKGNPTTDVLQWGWTRADNNIFKFGVAYTGDEPASFTPAKIDLSKFKADLKQVWADRNRQTGTSKESLGHLVADLYYNLATKDTNMKKYMLKFAWKDNTDYALGKDENGDPIIVTEDNLGLDHIATSEAELVFATIKPLSFKSGEAIAEKVDGITKSANGLIEKMEPYVDRLMNRVYSKLNLDSLYLDESVFDKIKMNDDGKYVMVIPDGAYIGYTYTDDWSSTKPVFAKNGGIEIDVDDLVSPMVQTFGKVNDAIDNIKSMLGKINGKNIGDFLEKFTNKFDKVIKNNADQMLQPVLLAIDKDGNVNRVSGIKAAPYEVSGEVTLKPTTYTAELFAPAYVKFVGCKDIDADGFNELIFSNYKELKFTPEKGKLYEITYEAADYSGNIWNKDDSKYYILGK